MELFSEEYFMTKALDEAKKAFELGEVPVGAIVVCNEYIVAKAHNSTEQLHDVTAHAEIIAITAAANYLQSKYLKQCTLYVTLEPCIMCAGALKWAQIGKIVYGAVDEKNGFMTVGKSILHPQTKLSYGVLENDCSKLLTSFFKSKRFSSLI
ncbi:MAG: nucleoside deaminase [Bacteroidia bacterium]|nr:nucleoside deaminase [Bacteroidia bacterium]